MGIIITAKVTMGIIIMVKSIRTIIFIVTVVDC